MVEEFSTLNHQLDTSRVHVHDAPGANIQMPNFAIPHLAFRQADVRTAGLNQRVGILAQQAVVSRLPRQRDGVSVGLGSVTPTVEDDEDEWFGTGQIKLLAFSSQLLAVSFEQ